MLPKRFKPAGTFELIRLGSDHDGGYLVDPKSIQEVVYRRLKYCLHKKEPLPDLLIIDGGKAQLNFAFSSPICLMPNE